MNSNSLKPRLTRPVEVLCRGVVVAVLPVKLTKIKAVLIPAGIIAGLHLPTLVSPETQNGLFLTQVTWAFGLGIALACIRAEFRPLIPVIVFATIIKGIFQFSVGDPGASPLIGILWGAPFLGLRPAGVVIF